MVEAGVVWIGVVVATALITLLLATLKHRPLRIWPTPGEKSWQSYVFWPLFRGLNVICFATAWLTSSGFLGLPTWLRVLAALVCAVSIATFLHSFFKLGRDNSYGAQDGLVTAGIYQWTRNPQNAMLVVVYGALAVAADSGPAYVLCAAMMAVYTLMVLCEEPWLEEAYGEAYRSYCNEVPRFFKWRRLLSSRG
jgi:protein-S-isoprenylcysteine O-methyltransferase Ste14